LRIIPISYLIGKSFLGVKRYLPLK